MKSLIVSVLVVPSLLSATPLDHRPPPAVAPELVLRHLAFGSCADETAEQPIWDAIVARKPQLWLWLGDNIYGDTHDMMLLASKWLALASKPGYQKLVESCPVIATWDDHDYGADDSGAAYPEKEHSKRLFLDFFSEPADSPRRARPGIHTSFLIGPPEKRVQIILLDLRTFRSQQLKRQGEREYKGMGGYAPDPSPEAAMLGEEQWKWLEGELSKPARLRLIACASQFVAAWNGFESWSNYPAERERMIGLVRSTRAEGVVFLSGDTHWTELNMEEPQGVYPLYDLTSSGLNQRCDPGPCHNRIGPAFGESNFGEVLIDWEKETLTLKSSGLTGACLISQEVPLQRLTFAPMNLAPATGDDAFVGVWNTEHGPLTLTRGEGERWTASYSGGTCELTLKDRVLAGKWAGDAGGGDCRFSLSRDGKHLFGTYGRGEGPPMLSWAGWR
jgi:alkaline phosphatase D